MYVAYFIYQKPHYALETASHSLTRCQHNIDHYLGLAMSRWALKKHLNTATPHLMSRLNAQLNRRYSYRIMAIDDGNYQRLLSLKQHPIGTSQKILAKVVDK